MRNICKKVEHDHATDADVLRLAEYCMRQRKWEEMGEFAACSVAVATEKWVVREVITMAKSRTGDEEGAADVQNEVLNERIAENGKLENDTLSAKANLGVTLTRLKRYDQAGQLLEAAVKGLWDKVDGVKKPAYIAACRGLANLYACGMPRALHRK
jgi:hypothetical protein